MQLPDFIAANLESILAEWEAFARTCIPAGEALDVAGLRDHAADILKTVARDLRRPQTEHEREKKSKGERGAVISPAQLHQIFSPLKRIGRGDAPPAHDSGSLGLGLYIANEIGKGHGGRIDIDSSDAGGTTFTVHLPRRRPRS